MTSSSERNLIEKKNKKQKTNKQTKKKKQKKNKTKAAIAISQIFYKVKHWMEGNK